MREFGGGEEEGERCVVYLLLGQGGEAEGGC